MVSTETSFGPRTARQRPTSSGGAGRGFVAGLRDGGTVAGGVGAPVAAEVRSDRDRVGIPVPCCAHPATRTANIMKLPRRPFGWEHHRCTLDTPKCTARCPGHHMLGCESIGSERWNAVAPVGPSRLDADPGAIDRVHTAGDPGSKTEVSSAVLARARYSSAVSGLPVEALKRTAPPVFERIS